LASRIHTIRAEGKRQNIWRCKQRNTGLDAGGLKEGEEMKINRISLNWFNNWFLVFISILLFTFFILAFIKPIRKRDWKSLGLYEAFIISLFTEMFGFPLTIYILSSFFSLPLTVDPLHGHLLAALITLTGIWSFA
jgi:hypothetical protein